MSESSQHIRLVEALTEHIKDHYLSGDSGRICIDRPGNNAQNLPPLINGYRPDLFVNNMPSFSIIGEAKTSWDIERPHTQEQLTAFMRYCSGQANTLLILAVPWDMVRLMKELIRNIKRKAGMNSVEPIVLERLPS